MSDPWTLLSLRGPRVLLALGVGAALSLAGSALQAIFSNPLCEPYTLGVSSGSALGAVLGVSLGFSWSWGGVSVLALVGALAFALILIAVSRGFSMSSSGLLLSGVMLGFLGSSLVAILMTFADPNGIQGAIFWLMGDLSRAEWRSAGVVIVLAIMGLIFLARDARAFDALMFGEEVAASVGVDPEAVRRRALVVTSLLVGASVSVAGIIGFVGLMVPHAVRRMGARLHGRLLILSALWGGTAMVASDLVARSVSRPYELPVGVVTALVGAPSFVLLLMKIKFSSKGGHL